MRPLVRLPPLAAALVAVCFSSALGACGGSPTKPSQAFLSGMEIAGPSQIAPGESAQFKVIGQYSDGSLRDLTNEAVWSSEDTSVLTATSGGTLVAGEIGETRAVASFNGRWAHNPIMVIPTGTFRLTVAVFEAGRPTFALPTAEISVVTPDGQALPAHGHKFYGAWGKVEVRATFPLFYQPEVRVVEVTEHQQLDLALIPIGKPVIDATGTYTMTLAAAASCGEKLPSRVRTRTYTATVAHTGADMLHVDLHGAVFESYLGVVGNSVEGRILDVGQARLNFAGREGVGWGARTLLLELLSSPDGLYEVWGSSVVRIDATGMSGALNGTMSFRDTTSLASLSCSAQDHALTMIRR